MINFPDMKIRSKNKYMLSFLKRFFVKEELVSKPIFIGPTINKPKWWEFWRWHLMPKYNQECVESKQKFLRIFGKPLTKEEREEYAYNFYNYLTNPPKPWFRRVTKDELKNRKEI